MASVCEVVGTLTIPNGQTQANWLASKLGFGAAVQIIIYAPATLTGTVTVLASPDELGTINDKLTVAGAAVTVPAGQATVIARSGFKSLSLVSSLAEGADRVFTVMAQMLTN